MHGDTPYWLVGPPPESPPLPWSGEVVPIDVPPVPVDVPIAGPVLHFIGTGEHAVWNDVWSWIKTGSKTIVDTYSSIESAIIQDVVNVVESYVGYSLEAVSGFINRTFDYAASGLDAINFWAADALSTAFGEIQGITAGLTELEAIVNAIEQHVIPGVFAELLGLIQGVDVALFNGLLGVETWAIDNIETPLLADIDGLGIRTLHGLETVLDDAKAYADQLVHDEALKRAAAIAAIASAVAAITTFVDECGQPMCDTMGPKTDLGKFLKGLHLAADAALIAALLNMNEQDLAGFIQTVTSHLGGVVGDVEQFLQPGGETVAGLIANATKDLI